MNDLNTKRFKCALGLSSMIAQAGSPADAEVMFSCHECSMSKLRRCTGPEEYTPPKEPIIIIPKEKNAPQKRRARKPETNANESSPQEPLEPVQALDTPAPAAEDSREELARRALMELARKPQRPDRDRAREIVRMFYTEIEAARKVPSGWVRIHKALHRFGFTIGRGSLQKIFEEMKLAKLPKARGEAAR